MAARLASGAWVVQGGEKVRDRRVWRAGWLRRAKEGGRARERHTWRQSRLPCPASKNEEEGDVGPSSAGPQQKLGPSSSSALASTQLMLLRRLLLLFALLGQQLQLRVGVDEQNCGPARTCQPKIVAPSLDFGELQRLLQLLLLPRRLSLAFLAVLAAHLSTTRLFAIHQVEGRDRGSRSGSLIFVAKNVTNLFSSRVTQLTPPLKKEAKKVTYGSSNLTVAIINGAETPCTSVI